MKKETREKGWEPMLDVTPSEKFFCTYGGPFAQKMELDRSVIERFLRFAQLNGGEGRLLLEESKKPRIRAGIDLNSDGSVTGRGSLRWDEKPEKWNKKKDPLLEIQADDLGWKIALNGNNLLEKLMLEDEDITQAMLKRRFIKGFNNNLHKGFYEVVRRDKLTEEGDPFLKSHIAGTIVHLSIYAFGVNFLFQGNYRIAAFELSVPIIINLIRNVYEDNSEAFKMIGQARRYKKKLTFAEQLQKSAPRMTVKSLLEVGMLGLEILDRVPLSFGYLKLRELTRRPLVRLTD